VASRLEAQGMLRKSDLKILRPKALYDWWTKARGPIRRHAFHVADPGRLVAEILDQGAELAVTTYYAENAYQGHLFPRRLDAYVRKDRIQEIRRLAVELGAQIGGTNFRLLTGDDALVGETIRLKKGRAVLPCAPVPQVILDLLTERGSAAEAAELLIRKVHPGAKARVR
jgi:hypothetical protein